jgi:hypothetical protein
MMLRNAILGFFVLLLAGVTVAAVMGRAAWPLVVVLDLIVVAIVFEHQRYQGRVAARGASPTAERFIDPESGRKVQVWTNKAGERVYVEEGKPEADAV